MAKTDERSRPLPGINQDHFALKFEAGFRRFGLVILLMIIAAALLGLFSGGWFSHAQQTNPDNSIQIHYQRFGRLENEIPLIITVKHASADRLIFRVGQQFMQRIKPGTVFPQPDHMYSQGQALYLVYNAVNTRGDFSVWIATTPDQPGKIVTSVAINDSPMMIFWQFIYP